MFFFEVIGVKTYVNGGVVVITNNQSIITKFSQIHLKMDDFALFMFGDIQNAIITSFQKLTIQKQGWYFSYLSSGVREYALEDTICIEFCDIFGHGENSYILFADKTHICCILCHFSFMFAITPAKHFPHLFTIRYRKENANVIIFKCNTHDELVSFLNKWKLEHEVKDNVSYVLK